MPRSPTLSKVVTVLVAAVLCLIIAWAIWQGQNAPARRRAQDWQRLLEIKNVGLALLENMPNQAANDVEQCVAAFAELAESLPDDPIGPRNLAIAKIIAVQKLEDKRSEEFREAVQACEAALAAVQQREGETGVYHMLAAKVAVAVDDADRVVREYRRAAELMPDDYVPWSELCLYSKGIPLEEVAKEAAQRAFDQQPRNIELILRRLEYEAADRDSSIIETLTAATLILRLFDDRLRQQGLSMTELLDEIVMEARSNTDAGWVNVRGGVARLANVIRSPDTSYQLDRARLQRHVLEYVIHDFADDVPDLTTPIDVEPTRASVRLEPVQGSTLDFANVTDVELADFDLDSRVDIIALAGGKLAVFTWHDSSATWRLLSTAAAPLRAQRVLLADIDRDTKENAELIAAQSCPASDLDVVLFGEDGVTLMMNRLDPATGERSLVPVEDPFDGSLSTEVTALTVADVDHDGDLDLIAATPTGISVWSNNENWGFTDISARSDIPSSVGEVTAIVPVDWNRTIMTDLLVVGPSGIGVLENVRHGRYRWQALPHDIADDERVRSFSLAEVDGNPSWDLITCGPQGISLSRTQIVEPGVVSPLDRSRISDFAATDIKPWDFDNDGLVDLTAWNEETIEVFRGTTGARFQREPSLIDPVAKGLIECEAGDFDADGDLDLLVVHDDGITGYINHGGNENSWVDLNLRAEEDPRFPSQRCNLWGRGSLVELKVGSTYQAQTVVGNPVHFGLGNREKADAVRVLWTNGVPQNEISPATRQTICQEQRLLLGSCPYLYTWTGERFDFFTDLLWAAPLGLQAAEGELVPWREWEYLLIPGDRLVAQNDEYRLQITEELWEAAYFDSVRLIAVDHPVDVDVYSNEKVGPAEIAEFKIHTARNPMSPVAACDARGRDVLDLIKEQDDRYVKLFDQRHKQGITEPHFVELDLGALDKPHAIKLFLTGWVFPSDPSINVAVSHNPTLAAAQPPSLWVPRTDGTWHEALPYIGFPGGKTKTIVVEISRTAFEGGDYRVRIATSMEIYWDSIHFTMDETTAPVQLTEIEPHAADLHYRGFSRRVWHPGYGPESYVYDDVSRDAAWPPMAGRFTRYGDVTKLIAESDDLLVVLGAGDEMTVRFKVPPREIPQGWTRDFILHNVGWDKDANLNTVSGHAVEPMPFRAMSYYPYTDAGPTESPAYREYLDQYQTRRQDFSGFRRQLQQRSASR